MSLLNFTGEQSPKPPGSIAFDVDLWACNDLSGQSYERLQLMVELRLLINELGFDYRNYCQTVLMILGIILSADLSALHSMHWIRNDCKECIKALILILCHYQSGQSS